MAGIPAAVGVTVHFHLMNKALDDEQRESTDQGRLLVLDFEFVSRWTWRGAAVGAVSGAPALLVGQLFTAGSVDATDLLFGVFLLAPAAAIGLAIATYRHLRIMETSIQAHQRATDRRLS